jgi:hypothetical protein
MADSSGTWRQHPLVVGHTYAAIESFSGFPSSTFVAGRYYALQRVAYSRYDSSTVFTFLPVDDSEPIYWWWHDEEPDDLCSRRFRVAT